MKLIFNDNKLAIPFYQNIEEQQYQVYGKNRDSFLNTFSRKCPNNILPPFQIKLPKTYGNVTFFQLYDLEDNLIKTLSTSDIDVYSYTAGKYYQYSGNGANVDNDLDLPSGYFYIKITIGATTPTITLYSDVLCVFNESDANTQNGLDDSGTPTGIGGWNVGSFVEAVDTGGTTNVSAIKFQ